MSIILGIFQLPMNRCCYLLFFVLCQLSFDYFLLQGQYLAGAFVVLMVSSGESIEGYAIKKAGAFLIPLSLIDSHLPITFSSDYA